MYLHVQRALSQLVQALMNCMKISRCGAHYVIVASWVLLLWKPTWKVTMLNQVMVSCLGWKGSIKFLFSRSSIWNITFDAGRKFERRSLALSTEGSSEPRLCCSVCKEMVADEKALERHNEEMHTPGREPQPQKSWVLSSNKYTILVNSTKILVGNLKVLFS